MAEEVSITDALYTREPRYAFIPRDTLRVYAESAGHTDLSDQVLDFLVEDVNYHVRELVQKSFEIMRNAKRRRLTTQDFTAALRWSDCQPLFGHGGSDPMSFQQFKDGDVYFADDSEIDVVQVALNEPEPVETSTTFVKGSWLTVEGVLMDNATQAPSIHGKVMPAAVVSSRSVSEDLLIYYDLVTKAILGSDTELMKFAFANLGSNSCITPILPYFINFVANGVKTVSHDTTQLVRLLHTVESLVTNPSLHLDPIPYLPMIVQTILHCVLEMQAASINSLNDHWFIMDISSRLLAFTICKWENGVNDLKRSTETSLSDALLDSSRSFCSHYGAIVGLLELGLTSLEDCLIPILPQYLAHLDRGRQHVSHPTPLLRTDSLIRADAQTVHGALLLVSIYIIRSHISLLSSSSSSTALTTILNHSPDDITSHDQSLDPSSLFTKLYGDLYEQFGDSLASLLPIIHLPPDYYLHPPFRSSTAVRSTHTASTVALGDENAAATGDDLLQQFLTSTTVGRTGCGRGRKRHGDQSERSSQSSDMSGGEEETDMAIKATVDDKSQGIKMTILKRPKTTTTALPAVAVTTITTAASKWPANVKLVGTDKKGGFLKPSPVPAGSSIPRAPSKKLSLVSVFAWVPMRTRDVKFVFKFQGRVQLCMFSERQKAQSLARAIAAQHAAASRYRSLCSALPVHGTRRKAVQGGTGDGVGSREGGRVKGRAVRRLPALDLNTIL